MTNQRETQRRKDGSGGGPALSGAPAEWIVGVISALLVLGALGLTVGDALQAPGGPPLLSIHHDSVIATPGGHLVTFTVRNDGAETAASVEVHGELSRGGESVEESQATLDYVPEGAERRGSLLFRDDPGAHTLELRVTGFAFP